MQAVIAGVKSIVGWDDNSEEASFKEKLALSVTVLCAIGVNLPKDALSWVSAANVDEYLGTMQTYFLNCEPLDNNGSEIVCSSNIPGQPSRDTILAEKILIGVGEGFQALMMLIILRNLIRTCTTVTREPTDDRDFSPLTAESEPLNESDSLIRQRAIPVNELSGSSVGERRSSQVNAGESSLTFEGIGTGTVVFPSEP